MGPNNKPIMPAIRTMPVILEEDKYKITELKIEI